MKLFLLTCMIGSQTAVVSDCTENINLVNKEIQAATDEVDSNIQEFNAKNLQNNSGIKYRFYIDSSGDTLVPTNGYSDLQGFSIPRNTWWSCELPLGSIDITKLGYSKQEFINKNDSVVLSYDYGYNFWVSWTGWDNSAEGKTPSTSLQTSSIDIKSDSNSVEIQENIGNDKKEKCELYANEKWIIDSNTGDQILSLSYTTKLWYSWRNPFPRYHASLLVLGPNGFSFNNSSQTINFKSKLTTNFGNLFLESGNSYVMDIQNLFDFLRQCYLDSVKENWNSKSIINFLSLTTGEGSNGRSFTQIIGTIFDAPVAMAEFQSTLLTGVEPYKPTIKITYSNNLLFLYFNNSLIASTPINSISIGTNLFITSVNNLEIAYTK